MLNADPARPDFEVADLEVPVKDSKFRLDARKAGARRAIYISGTTSPPLGVRSDRTTVVAVP